MAKLAFVFATVLFAVVAWYVADQTAFLAPYRSLIVHRYGLEILVFCGVLFVNLFAAVYWLTRTLFLADTGRKLAHLEKQLRGGSSISDELAGRLAE